MIEKTTGKDITFLQKQEVEAGRKSGLSPEQIRIYTEPGLNFKQMKVIREGLSSGLKEEDAKLVAQPWISAEAMKEMIAEMKQGKKVTVQKKMDFRRWILPSAAGIAALLAVGVLLLEEPEEPPVLELKQSEIRLACGMKFEPEQYVRQSGSEDYNLILPAAFTAEKPEVRLAVYELKGKEESIRKILKITVSDETAPEINLLQDHAELLTATKFSCRAYLKNAYDAVDGDLTQRVKCSDQLEQSETQTVLYTVKDRSGNEAKKELTVHYADFGMPEEMKYEEAEEEAEKEDQRKTDPIPMKTEEETSMAPSPAYEPEYYEETEVIEYTQSVNEEVPVSWGDTYVEHSFG